METFLEAVNKKIHGVPLQACYHCRKCSAGCPAASYMEFNPNKVIKMIQNGQKDKVLSSKINPPSSMVVCTIRGDAIFTRICSNTIFTPLAPIERLASINFAFFS